MKFARSRNLTASLCIMAMASHLGCATPHTSYRPKLSDGSDPASGSVGLAVGRFPPTVHLEALVRGKGSGAAKGATLAFECLEAAKGDSSGIGALVALVCMPIAAVAGAVKGASIAAPEKEIEQAETRFDPKLKGQTYVAQEALEAQFVQYATEVGLAPFTQLDDRGPAGADEAPEYQLRQDERADVVIEVALLDLTASTIGIEKLEYQVAVTARGRMVRTANNAVLDSFYHRASTVAHSAEEWAGDDGKLLTAELNRAYRSIAEAFIDEWLLVERRAQPASAKAPAGRSKVHDETAATKPSKRLVPAYMLHPLYPPVVDRGTLKSVAHNWPVKRIQIESLAPALRWESFPRPHDFDDLSIRHDELNNVTYDLRLFRGEIPGRGDVKLPSYAVVLPVEQVLNERGLTGSTYQLAELEPCTVYLWTVRARYLRNGRPQTTEWAWPFSPQLSHGGPWGFRRSLPTWSDFPARKLPTRWPEYLPFMTPARDAQECKLR